MKQKSTNITRPNTKSIKGNDINSLLEIALESNSSIEQFKELMKMKYEFEDRQARKIFHENLCKAQADFPPIKRTRPVNSKSGKNIYNYAPLEQMIKQVVPVLREYGFSYGWTEEFPEPKVKRINFHLTGHGHTESCSIDLPIMNRNDMVNDIQQSGATSTYGRRYTMSGMLGLTTGDDIDGKQPEQKKKDPPKQDLKILLPEIKADTICSIDNLNVKYSKLKINQIEYLYVNASNPKNIEPLLLAKLDESIKKYINLLKEYSMKDLKTYIEARPNIKDKNKLTVKQKLDVIELLKKKFEGQKNGK